MFLFARESQLTGRTRQWRVTFQFYCSYDVFYTRSTLRYYFFEQGKLLRVVQVVAAFITKYSCYAGCFLGQTNFVLLYKCFLFPPTRHIFLLTNTAFALGLKQTCEISCNGSLLSNVMNVKLPRLEIDEELSFSEHITTVCKKVSQRIGLLKKIMSYLPLKQRLL